MGKEIVLDKIGRKFLGEEGLDSFEYRAKVSKDVNEDGVTIVDGYIDLEINANSKNITVVGASFFDVTSESERARALKYIDEEIKTAAVLRTQIGRAIKDLCLVRDTIIECSEEVTDEETE